MSFGIWKIFHLLFWCLFFSFAVIGKIRKEMEQMQSRLSKWQVMALSRELHDDEEGIRKVCHLMLHSEEARSASNAAWILSHCREKTKGSISLLFMMRLQTG